MDNKEQYNIAVSRYLSLNEKYENARLSTVLRRKLKTLRDTVAKEARQLDSQIQSHSSEVVIREKIVCINQLINTGRYGHPSLADEFEKQSLKPNSRYSQ